MGEREPLENKETTHGMCSQCRQKWEDEFREYQSPQGPTIEIQIQKINLIGALHEFARFFLTLACIIVGTLLIGHFLPME